MPTIETIYLGDLRAEAEHLQSGTHLVTDAPTDNHGLGQSFSPTDLVATALGSCMITIMDMAARERNIDLRGTRIEITKVMGTEPRRIIEIVVNFYITGDFTDKEKKILERAADTCPVAKSLHPDLKQSIKFNYQPE